MKTRKEAGFTLIEMIIVIVLIGTLTAILANTFIGQVGKSKVKLAKIGIAKLEQALEMYKLDNGRYPTSEQGLAALVRAPTIEPLPRDYPPGGYAKADSLKDPWTERFIYERPGGHNTHSFDLYTLGADSLEGGEGEDADIGNWDTGEEL